MPRLREVMDPVLGKLVLDQEDELWWAASLPLRDRALTFHVGGDQAPDPALVAHAREVATDFSTFKALIDTFLAAEATRPDLSGFADEVRSLQIEWISLTWPHRPRDGMIYFAGPHPFRLWRCDYLNGKPQRLGFDS